MSTNTNLKFANSSSNYYIIVMVQNLEKLKNFKFTIFSHLRDTKCRVEANNNCEAVVVCARHVVKRLSKRCALVKYKQCKWLIGIILVNISTLGIFDYFLVYIYIVDHTRLTNYLRNL